MGGALEEGEILGAEGVTGDAPRAPDLSKKHPLEHHWTLWYRAGADNSSKRKTDFEESIRPVYTFNTVEDFWCMFNNIVAPSKLMKGADYALFKEGIKPAWEDPRIASGGGRWVASAPKGSKVLDVMWLHGLLGMIGEQFTEGDGICGLYVNIRTKGDRCEMWTSNTATEPIQLSIGKQFKQFLDVGSDQKVEFENFSDKSKRVTL